MANKTARAGLTSIILLAAATVNAAAQNAPPKVTKIDGTLEADCLLDVHIDHLAEWVAAGHDPTKLVPVIEGLALKENYPDQVHAAIGDVHFHLRITKANESTWVDLLGAPTSLTRPVTFSVGIDNLAPFDSVIDRANPAQMVVIDVHYAVIAIVIVLFTIVAFLRLARKTNLIREPVPAAEVGGLGPYNLGRTQMAFWFLLICMSYISIWLITGALDTITASLLGLMGISAGTALGEAMIDADKTQSAENQVANLASQKQAVEQGLAEMQPQAGLADRQDIEETRTRLNHINRQLGKLATSRKSTRSRGFVCDILSGGADYSLHRFQICVWTVVLGVIFLSSVYNGLTMPEFSPTLLGLMGLSSGTYIGFKFPEKA